jgi:hypothetical protein
MFYIFFPQCLVGKGSVAKLSSKGHSLSYSFPCSEKQEIVICENIITVDKSELSCICKN